MPASFMPRIKAAANVADAKRRYRVSTLDDAALRDVLAGGGVPFDDEPSGVVIRVGGEDTTWDEIYDLSTRGALPDDPCLHAAVLVYASDRTLLRTAARMHGGMRSRLPASLDHAVWLHRRLPGVRRLAQVRQREPGVEQGRRRRTARAAARLIRLSTAGGVVRRWPSTRRLGVASGDGTGG